MLQTAEPAAEPARNDAPSGDARVERLQRAAPPVHRGASGLCFLPILRRRKRKATTPSVADSAPALEVAESHQNRLGCKEEIAVKSNTDREADAVRDAPFPKNIGEIGI